jgi:hypothetical protein
LFELERGLGELIDAIPEVRLIARRQCGLARDRIFSFLGEIRVAHRRSRLRQGLAGTQEREEEPLRGVPSSHSRIRIDYSPSVPFGDARFYINHRHRAASGALTRVLAGP